MPIPHLVIASALTLSAIATATAVVCARMSRIETATWRVAVVDHEILAAVQRDAAQLN